MHNKFDFYCLHIFQKHNKYLRAKKYLGVDKEEAKILHCVVMQRLHDLKDEKRRNEPFKWK